MKLRLNKVMGASKRGLIGPLRRFQGKDRGPRRRSKTQRLRIKGQNWQKTPQSSRGACHGPWWPPRSRYAGFHGSRTPILLRFRCLSSRLFGFHTILSILCYEFIFKGFIFVAKSYFHHHFRLP